MLNRRNLSQQKGPLAEINVVPYIDVMLVLLVIFMITAPLLSQGINVKLPQAQAKALPPTELPVIVSVDQLGRYYLNVAPQPKQEISRNELLYRIAALLSIAKDQQQEKPVYVKGDKNVAYNKVVQLMSLLQKAGAKDVGLITEATQN